MKVAAAIASLALLLGAAPAAAGEIVVSKRGGGAERKNAIEDYWTAKRMAHARPLELERTDDGEAELRLGEEDSRNHPSPFESGPVANPSTPPNTVNGKIFGRMPGVGAYECSATSVDAGNRNLIFTAGHCVAEPYNREIATKLVFVPSYHEGDRPYGTWAYERIVVLRSWRRNGNFNYDFAAVEMSPQSGVDLQDVVGGAPLATHLPADQTYLSVGYPSNLNRGQVMRYCLGRFDGYDPRPLPNGPTPISMGCDMGAGASGGGWFVNGHLNSVTSFGYEDHRNVGYGPYFGNKTLQVYERGAR
jgi:hypothetical protein